MKINNVGLVQKVENYKIRDEKRIQNVEEVKSANDKCEISAAAKNLSKFTVNDADLNIDIKTDEQVQSIKEKIANGEYKIDVDALAKSISEAMKGWK